MSCTPIVNFTSNIVSCKMSSSSSFGGLYSVSINFGDNTSGQYLVVSDGLWNTTYSYLYYGNYTITIQIPSISSSMIFASQQVTVKPGKMFIKFKCLFFYYIR